MHRIAAVVAGLSLAFVGTSTTFAATINVPADQPTIAAAISASVNGDVIAIAAGTYYEHSLNPGGKAITIQGTLNGDGSLATTIYAQQAGSVFNINSGEGNETVIKNLMITGGSNYFGGGIYCQQSSPTISGCAISGNTSDYGAGGIMCASGSNPIIDGCLISGNTCGSTGGGIYCDGGFGVESNPTITNCTISDNTSVQASGIYCAGSSPTITNCTISGNTASDGGGIVCYESSNPTISDCTITGNTASQFSGGGIHCTWESNPTISGCLISDNTALLDGGGIYCRYESNPTIDGCTITGNTTNDEGGGIYCYGGVLTITGSTITGNTAATTLGNGGGIFQGPGAAALSNTIVCGNVPDQVVALAPHGTFIDNGGNIVQDICPIPPGVCCTGNEIFCVQDVEEADCLTYGGQWLGEATSCDDCPPPVELDPTGACCVSSGCHALTETACAGLGGTWLGEDASCDDCAPTCQGDANADGVVDVFDLLKVIDGWGTCP
ncbi:MAG: right-handed parallel beta-helix repeat-containing protein [Phycisphaerales bacterium]|nr:right-handed parallel beta-helix repeat-containing protein [Phycisphaerales bacterium]